MLPDIQVKVSVVGLFVEGDEVLLIHQIMLPEADCWDLPGGRLEPGESLLDGLVREVKEETGLDNFQVQGLLDISDN